MPKLSYEALEKRFTCHICGKSMRTRQGLSGHIRFKHGKEQVAVPYNDYTDFTIFISQAIIAGRGYLGESNPHFNTLRRIEIGWKRYLAVATILKIPITYQDFKNFVASACASE